MGILLGADAPIPADELVTAKATPDDAGMPTIAPVELGAADGEVIEADVSGGGVCDILKVRGSEGG